MLVVSRKVGEKLLIGGNVVVVIHRIAGNRVTIGVEAPSEVQILRGEKAKPKQDDRREQGEAA